MPIRARIGVKDEGLSIRTKKLLPSIPPRLSIHAVTVVPIFAPIMTLIAWRSVISPELTKPTTITVVAEELWITAVTPRPVKRPMAVLVVIFPRMDLRLSPARRSRACPIIFMPNRNRQSPPIIVSKSKKSILNVLSVSHFVCNFILATSNSLAVFCKMYVKYR